MDGVRGGVYVGKAGDSKGSKKVVVEDLPQGLTGLVQKSSSSASSSTASGLLRLTDSISIGRVSDVTIDNNNNKNRNTDIAREALKFLFSDEGYLFREFILEEVSNAVDAVSRDATRELLSRLSGRSDRIPNFIKVLAPQLTQDDRKVVDSISRLINFLINDSGEMAGYGMSANGFNGLLSLSRKPENRERLIKFIPVLREFAPKMREFGRQIVARLVEKGASRVIRASTDAIFGVISSEARNDGSKMNKLSNSRVTVGGFGYRSVR